MKRNNESEKIRILQSVNSLGMGGTVVFVMNFFRHIDKEKFQVDFVIYDDSRMDFAREVEEAGSHIYVCASKLQNKFMKLLSEMLQVRKLLKKNHYDVIHCHANSFRELFRGAVPGSYTKNTYVIAHSHNPGEPKNTWFDNTCRDILKTYVSNIVDIGCTCSDVAAKGKYTDEFMHTPKYKIIHNAIDTRCYKYDKKICCIVRRELGIAEEEFVVGHVGRMSYQKNDLFLIDIFKEFLKVMPNSKLLFVGDGELKKDIEDRISAYHMEASVIFTGKCDNAGRYYHAMDCFLLPSLYEGFPFVLVEAQINGLRCVVSDVVTKTVNISGGVHFVALTDNPCEWAHQIKKVCYGRMTDGEIQEVIELYDLNREVKKLESIYEKLSEEKK